MSIEDHLTTEARNPHSAEIDRLDAAGIVALMNGEDAKVVEAVGAADVRAAVARAIEWTAERFQRGGG